MMESTARKKNSSSSKKSSSSHSKRHLHPQHVWKGEEPSLLLLSDETLLEIMQYLDAIDLSSLAVTCSRMRMAAYDNLLWQRICETWGIAAEEEDVIRANHESFRDFFKAHFAPLFKRHVPDEGELLTKAGIRSVHPRVHAVNITLVILGWSDLKGKLIDIFKQQIGITSKPTPKMKHELTYLPDEETICCTNAHLPWLNSGIRLNIDFFRSYDTAEVDGLRQVDRKKKTANTLYAFMSVFSVVSPYSFESLRTQGLPDLPYFNGKPPAVLGGLEADKRTKGSVLKELRFQSKHPISADKGLELASQGGYVSYVECGVNKDDKGVSLLFHLSLQAALITFFKLHGSDCLIS